MDFKEERPETVLFEVHQKNLRVPQTRRKYWDVSDINTNCRSSLEEVQHHHTEPWWAERSDLCQILRAFREIMENILSQFSTQKEHEWSRVLLQGFTSVNVLLCIFKVSSCDLGSMLSLSCCFVVFLLCCKILKINKANTLKTSIKKQTFLLLVLQFCKLSDTHSSLSVDIIFYYHFKATRGTACSVSNTTSEPHKIKTQPLKICHL